MINYIPNDLMSLILDIRSKEMKKDKELKMNKIKYDRVVYDLEFVFRINKNNKDIHGSIEDFNQLYIRDMIDTKKYGFWIKDRYDLDYNYLSDSDSD